MKRIRCKPKVYLLLREQVCILKHVGVTNWKSHQRDLTSEKPVYVDHRKLFFAIVTFLNYLKVRERCPDQPGGATNFVFAMKLKSVVVGPSGGQLARPLLMAALTATGLAW